MQLEIIHHTCYLYSAPVFLEPMMIRLRPRSDASQMLRSFQINISPQSDGLTSCIGVDGGGMETAWFSGTHRDLRIETRSIVETHRGDPYHFLITDQNALTLPLRYEPHLARLLAPYRERESDAPEVSGMASEVMNAANYETITFLSLLVAYIPRHLAYLLREHGEPWRPEDTLRQGKGACRDFAVLFVEACRAAGIAARFVSGYCLGDVSAGSHMHAWAEVYLPGAGWRGYDPSRGLAISEDHIAVAAGQNPLDAAPTMGSFRGQAESVMEVDIRIRQLQAEDPL